MMSQKSQMKKSPAFHGFAKMAYWLQSDSAMHFQGVSESCLGVFEDIWQCLLVSVLFLGIWRGVSIDLGDILGCHSCLGVFEGVFGDSLHEGFSQNGAN